MIIPTCTQAVTIKFHCQLISLDTLKGKILFQVFVHVNSRTDMLQDSTLLCLNNCHAMDLYFTNTRSIFKTYYRFNFSK